MMLIFVESGVRVQGCVCACDREREIERVSVCVSA